MKTIKLKAFQINNLFSGCELIGDNEMLKTDTVQKISLLREYTLPVVRSFEKGQTGLIKKCKMMRAVDGRIMATADFTKSSAVDQTKLRDTLDTELDAMN